MIRFLVVFLLFGTLPCLADVRLPKILSSHMVLQRENEVRIWGWAEPGESVTVTCDWLDAPASIRADRDGRWSTKVRTGQAGGPHQIVIKAKNTITLEDLMFGEVWLASGQSNMEMPLVKVSGAYTGIRDSVKEVAAADYPDIRLFQAGNFSSTEPLEDVQTGITMYGIPPAECTWQKCSPETVSTFSSTAYFFARELHTSLKVPIGIIDSSWGGTSAEAWTPLPGLKKLDYASAIKQANELAQKPDQKIPSRLYNGMIHPLRNFRIAGAIWYQGEGNAGRADKYQQLFSTMITQWRATFGYDFSFYFAQIAPFKYNGVNAAYLREAQLKTMSLPKTGMAVTMDIGHLTDIHPKNKQEVGRRLALWARARDYGQSVEFSGPVVKNAVFKNGRARLTFDYSQGGLKTHDGKPLSHFQMAGSDKQFHPAIAEIDGDSIVVTSVQVAHPEAVRYGFQSDAMPNLINATGLPASSFRTDSW